MIAPAYDVVVAGLGLSTAPVVEELVERTPARILVLDRAAMWDSRKPYPFDDLQIKAWRRRHRVDYFGLDGPVSHVPRWVQPGAGGGSIHWYGQLSRFQASDFEMRTRFGDRLDTLGDNDMTDWPLSFQVLAPHYDEVERRLSPFGHPYGWTSSDYRRLDCQYYVARQATSTLERKVIDLLHDQDVDAYIGQTCLGGRRWENMPVDPQTLLEGGLPLQIRTNWYDRIVRLAATSDRLTLLGGHELVDIVGSREGVEAVRARTKRNPVTFETALCVIGLSPIESVGLLARSGVATTTPLLGRGFTSALQGKCYVTLDSPLDRSTDGEKIGRFSNIVVKDYYSFEEGPLCKLGKFSIYDAHNIEEPPTSTLPPRLSALKISFKGESIAWSGKRLSFHDGEMRLTYEPHPHDVLVAEHLPPFFERLARCLGGRVIHAATPASLTSVNAHQHGGACFGDDQNPDSVLNEQCEVRSLPGVYVVDASSMPTSGATNVSHTMMANALRVASVIVARLGAQLRSHSDSGELRHGEPNESVD